MFSVGFPSMRMTWSNGYNEERPHQALEMQTPASRYQPSARSYEGLEELEYPAHD